MPDEVPVGEGVSRPPAPEEVEWDGERFKFLTEDDLLLAETAAIEKALKVNMDQLGDPGLATSALTALLWVSIKRRRPTLKFADIANQPVKAFRFFAPAPEPTDDEVEVEPVDPSRPAGPDATPCTEAAPASVG